jgi:hypothetical protein
MNNKNHFFRDPRHMTVEQLAALPSLIEIEMYDGITVEHHASPLHDADPFPYSVDMQSLEDLQDEEEVRAARRMTKLRTYGRRNELWN